MLYLLDTDILSRYAESSDARLISRIRATPVAELAVTVITVAEQSMGWLGFVNKVKNPYQIAFGYDQFAKTLELLRDIQIIRYSEEAQAIYRTLHSSVKNVGGNDLRIAAIALEVGATVVTRNVRDFSRVSGLFVENWASIEE